jgi:hypothetical protein
VNDGARYIKKRSKGLPGLGVVLNPAKKHNSALEYLDILKKYDKGIQYIEINLFDGAIKGNSKSLNPVIGVQ